MTLKTASAVVNYISRIESASADFYRNASRRFPDEKPLFDRLAKGNKKYGKRIKKVYYSAVTDALETNFSFEGLDANVEIPEADKPESVKQLLALGLALEKRIQSFYVQAAELSKELLADVHRAMKRVADDRDQRISEIGASLQQL